MFQTVLVPSDLTDKADRALASASRLARMADGEPLNVHLLHVIETLRDTEDEEVRDFYEQLEERARSGLEERSHRLIEEGFQTVVAVRYGNRVRTIVDYATEVGADIVVLGSHVVEPERPGAGLASISYQVAALAPCSVLLLKHRSTED